MLNETKKFAKGLMKSLSYIESIDIKQKSKNVVEIVAIAPNENLTNVRLNFDNFNWDLEDEFDHYFKTKKWNITDNKLTMSLQGFPNKPTDKSTWEPAIESVEDENALFAAAARAGHEI